MVLGLELLPALVDLFVGLPHLAQFALELAAFLVALADVLLELGNLFLRFLHSRLKCAFGVLVGGLDLGDFDVDHFVLLDLVEELLTRQGEVFVHLLELVLQLLQLR